MRTIIVTGEPPIPETTGPRLLITSILRRALQLGACELVGAARNTVEAAQWGLVADAFPHAKVRETVPLVPDRSWLGRAATTVPRRFLPAHAPFLRPVWVNHVAKVIAAANPEVVHVTSFHWDNLQLSDNVRYVLSPYDAFSLRANRATRDTGWGLDAARAIGLQKLWRVHEAAFYPKFNAVAALSRAEQEWFDSFLPTGIVQSDRLTLSPERLSLLTGLRSAPRRQRLKRKPRVAIIGNFAAIGTARPLVRLLRNVDFGALMSVADVFVWGRAPAHLRDELARRGLSHVEDTNDYFGTLATVDVAVQPVDACSGIQTRVLDAMAAGVPVVGSRSALEPILERGSRPTLSPHLVAQCGGIIPLVMELLEDRHHSSRIVEQCQQLVTAEFSDEAGMADLERLYFVQN